MVYRFPSIDKLILLHNDIRKNYGWFNSPQPLIIDEYLVQYAQKWAVHLSQQKTLIHSNINNITKLGFMSAAENIAYGQENEESVMQTWVNSRGHKKNILNPSYKHIGCGFNYDNEDNLYWCVCFAGRKKN